MALRTLLAGILAATCCNAAPAQSISGRVDLEVVSRSPFPQFVIARVIFADGNQHCPEDQGTLRISNGRWIHHRLVLPNRERPVWGYRAKTEPIDDETYLHRIETADCRIDLTFRQQVRRGEVWVSLLVPKQRRPSIPAEERQELQRQMLDRLRQSGRQTPAPDSSDRVNRWNDAMKELRSAGSLQLKGGTASWGFPFEDPPACFEGIGEYRIERSGILYSFLTKLPGDLNRFVIERSDMDSNGSRLQFTGGDCRFELAVSQSVSRDGQWVKLPLAQIPAQ